MKKLEGGNDLDNFISMMGYREEALQKIISWAQNDFDTRSAEEACLDAGIPVEELTSYERKRITEAIGGYYV